jgi:ABC-type transport system substrate-binding protein
MVDAARREPDADRRLGQYRQLATYVKDQAFVLPLANYVAAYGTRSNVHGLSRQPLAPYPVLEDLWLA